MPPSANVLPDDPPSLTGDYSCDILCHSGSLTMNSRLVLRLVCIFSVAMLTWQRLDSQPRSLHRLAESQRAEVPAVVSWPFAGQAAYPAGRFLVKADNEGRMNFDTTLAKRFQRAIDSVRFVYGVPGISAAVLVRGQGTWLGATGFSTVTPPDSIRPEMLFNIASNTKSFISAIMLKLQEEGKLSLDDSIGRYLPAFPNISGRITIRQLLNMTSGLFDYFNDSDAWWYAMRANPNRYWAPEEILATFVGPPPQQPGISFRYCNTSAILAGMIVRNVAHTSISAQLHQRVFEPLLLQRTYFPLEDTLTGPIAHPVLYHGDVSNLYCPALYSMMWTAGAMFSTAENAARWADALYSGQLLTPASLAQLLTVVPAVIRASPVKHQAYGLFTIQLSLFGKPLWGHGGDGLGYVSWITYYPPSGVSVVVLLNTEDDSAFPAMDAALVALYREYFRTQPSPGPAALRTLYAVSGTDETGQLLVMNTTNGAARVVGPTQYGTIVSIAVHPRTGKLYGLSQTPSPEIVQINPSTGEAWPRSMLPFNSGLARGMAFTLEGESIVSLIDGRLYRVDLGSGDTTLLSRAGMGFSKIAVNPLNGELWGIPFDPSSRDMLYKINPATGDTTFKGTTGFSLPTLSLAFDHTGNLFGLITNGVDPENLIRIDTATGAGTMVGSLGIPDAFAMTFSPDTIMSSIMYPVNEVPDQFALMQNFPNPFNPSTTIKFELPKASEVRLSVYDLLGREASVLVNDRRDAGVYEVKFDAAGLSSGVYFYRIQAGDFIQTKRLLLLK
jgi:D-alanyl-D-alanine carboxypeptidase